MGMIFRRPASADFISVVWLAAILLPLSVCAEDVLSFRLDSVQQLRQIAGTSGVRVAVGDQHYFWDRYASGPDDGGRWIRPNFQGMDAGRWRAQGVQSASHGVTREDEQSSLCPASLRVAPQPMGWLTHQVLKAALVEAVRTGCPVAVQSGVHPIDRDLIIETDNVVFECKPGAVFRKTRIANAFWFRGNGIGMSGCEIDGAGYGGSGLIVDFSARDARIVDVFSHHHGGHGVLNRGVRTVAQYNRTEDNQKIGFANDAAKESVIRHLLSRNNGNEGLTVDNPGTRSIRVVGGLLEGNCRKGGVGNLGVDAAVDVVIEGMILRRPKSACPWNLTAQNNAGHTDRLSIRGGYYDGASDGDIHFRTNREKNFVVRDSSVAGIISLSSGPAVAIDAGGERNSVSTTEYSGRLLLDMD